MSELERYVIPRRYKLRWFLRGFFFQPVNHAQTRREMDELVALNREKGLIQ